MRVLFPVLDTWLLLRNIRRREAGGFCTPGLTVSLWFAKRAEKEYLPAYVQRAIAYCFYLVRRTVFTCTNSLLVAGVVEEKISVHVRKFELRREGWT